MPTAQEVASAVRECADQACQEQYPIRFTYKFVKDLMSAGWTQAEAEEVGRRAITIIDSYRGVSPQVDGFPVLNLDPKGRRKLHSRLLRKQGGPAI